jgi:hypothetical protein
MRRVWIVTLNAMSSVEYRQIRSVNLRRLAAPTFLTGDAMYEMLAMMPVVGAAGYALIYLLFGGGLGGAVLIFFVAKLLGR